MATLVRKSMIDSALAEPPVKGKRLLERFKSFAESSGFPGKILEDTEVTNEAEVHRTEGDLWFCLEGEVTFVSGGELIDPREHKTPDELKGSGISGGTEYLMKPGDWLWIPAGEPHLHKTDATARLIIIKILEKSK